MACEDPDCHCEDGLDWDYYDAIQYTWDLAAHTRNCYRLAAEYVFEDDGSVWTVTVSCDTTKPKPIYERKTMQPLPIGFEPDASELKARDTALAKLVETLNRMKVAEFEEILEEDHGTSKIVARWDGPFEKDPRWAMPSNAEVM